MPQMGKLGITVLASIALLASGCGAGSDHSAHMAGGGMANAQMTDPMFTAQMIPHHQAAIDMAALAPSRAEHPEIKQLAAQIAGAQAAEIKLMNKVTKQNNWDPNAKMHHSSGDGMSEHEMGMDMDISKLKTAKRITASQTAQIKQMKQWYLSWYNSQLG